MLTVAGNTLEAFTFADSPNLSWNTVTSSNSEKMGWLNKS